jgi:serine/threonine protein kinase/TolA-binding protein
MTAIDRISERLQSESDELDRFVDAYERSRGDGDIRSLDEFLPSQDHPFYLSIATELVRVDMEHRWQKGDSGHATLETYRHHVPQLFDSADHLAEIAFEEYRLRRLNDDQVSPEEYTGRYGISTQGWPRGDVVEEEGSRDGSSNLARSGESLDHQLVDWAAACDAFPKVGESFLGFRIIQELGRGAFARVFLASQDDLASRPVVLKVFVGSSGEPQNLARLQHTNVVPIHSLHRLGQTWAICMPYLGACTLAHFLESLDATHLEQLDGQSLLSTIVIARDASTIAFPPKGNEITTDDFQQRATTPVAPTPSTDKLQNYTNTMISLAAHLADGLAYAHRQGIVHRDLKPANILLGQDGEPRLLDFNLAHDTGQAAQAAKLVGGTLPYMAPEHLEAISHGGEVDYRADIYAMGVMLFEMLTLRRPFPDRIGSWDTIVSHMIADRRAQLPRLQALNPRVAPGIQSIVDRCLDPDPARRYQDGTELQTDLQRHVQSLPLKYAPNVSVRERFAKWCKRHPRVSSAAAVASILLTALTIVSALVIVRGQQLARAESLKYWHDFSRSYQEARAALSTPTSDLSVYRAAREMGENLLDTYPHLVSGSEDDKTNDPSRHLPPEELRQLRSTLSELLYLMSQRSLQVSANLDDAFRWNKQATALSAPATPLALRQQHEALLARRNPDANLSESNPLTVPIGPISPDAASHPLDERVAIERLIEAGKAQAAIDQLQHVIATATADAADWLLLGNAHAALKQYSEASSYYTVYISMTPKSFFGYFQRGRCALDQQQWAQARDDFSRALERRPDLTAALLNRALAHRNLGELALAEQDITRAIQLGAPETRAYFLRSSLRRQQQQHDLAAEDFAEGLARTPSDELSWIARGVARVHTEPEQALEDFRQALRLYPASRSALVNMVFVLTEKLHRDDEGLVAINRLIELDPTDTDGLAARAVQQARMGLHDAAVSDANALLQRSHAPLHLMQAACVYSHLSKVKTDAAAEAIALLRRALQTQPGLLETIEHDPDLEPLRKQEAYQALAQQARAWLAK